MEIGADPNFETSLGSAIHMAVKRNNIDLVKIMMQNAANVNLKDNNGTTPLLCC